MLAAWFFRHSRYFDVVEGAVGERARPLWKEGGLEKAEVRMEGGELAREMGVACGPSSWLLLNSINPKDYELMLDLSFPNNS